jgi:hypothetical protein
MAYATVHKEREGGHVVGVEQRVALGTEHQVAEALAHGSTSPTINTNYVERYHGTQRHLNLPVDRSFPYGNDVDRLACR